MTHTAFLTLYSRIDGIHYKKHLSTGGTSCFRQSVESPNVCQTEHWIFDYSKGDRILPTGHYSSPSIRPQKTQSEANPPPPQEHAFLAQNCQVSAQPPSFFTVPDMEPVPLCCLLPLSPSEHRKGAPSLRLFLTTLTPPIPLFPTLQGDPPQQPGRNSQRFQSRQYTQSLTVNKCMNIVLESAIISVAIRQIKLIYFPSQVVRFFRNMSIFL